jgi:hypothetical protein
MRHRGERERGRAVGESRMRNPSQSTYILEGHSALRWADWASDILTEASFLRHLPLKLRIVLNGGRLKKPVSVNRF